MRDLRLSLQEHDAALMRVVAQSWGVDLTGLSQQEAAEELSAAMLGADLPSEVGELPAAERAAVQALLAGGGRMLADSFFRQFGSIRPVGPGRLTRERPWAEPESPAEALWYRGLLFRGFERTELGSQEFVYLPDDVRRVLPALTAALARPQIAPSQERVTRWPPAANLVDDFCTVLAYAQRNLIPVHPQPAAPEDALLAYLRCKERTRLQMVWTLALETGLLDASGSAVRPHPRAARQWLQAPYPEQAAALAQSWLDSAAYNDLWNVPSLRPEPTGWQNDPRPPRQLMLDILGDLDPNTWWQLDSLLAGVKAAIPDFQRTSGKYDAWYLRDAVTNEYLLGFEHWDRVEGALLRFLVVGPLHWLGLVELGEDANSEVVAFCPTAAGRAFAQVKSFPYPPGPTEARIRVNADATISVPVATDRFTRFQVARLTDWEPVAPGETVYWYRLTPRSLTRAGEAGIALPRALTFLASRSGQPLPEPVKKAVESWEEKGVQVRLRHEMLLHVRDAGLLDELRAAPRVQPLLGEAIGPLVVTVRTADWRRLVSAIAEMGLLSDVELGASLGSPRDEATTEHAS